MDLSIPDGGQGGHLYKFVTVLGVFIFIASSYLIAVAYDSHDARVRENVGRILEVKGAPKETRDFWSDYLVQKRDDTKFIIGVSFSFATIGICIAVGAAIGWWWKVQRLEDEIRQLEFARRKHELDALQGKQKLVGVE